MDKAALDRFIVGPLPETQSIHAYVVEYFPDDPDQQADFEMKVIDSCKTGKLAYVGNIDGWTQLSTEADPYPGTTSTSVGFGSWDGDYPDIICFNPCDSLVERTNLEELLQQASTRSPLDLGKKLIAQQRTRTELGSLINEILAVYSIEVGEPRGAKTAMVAWGDLVANKVKSPLIKEIIGIRGTASIILNAGDRIDKADFCKMYNRRFK